MHSFSRIVSVVLLALLATPTAAFWRLLCPTMLVKERADPIVSPGAVADHVHTVAGGNAFGLTLDYNKTQASTCSSCMVKQDKSNYWTPQLYFHAENGSYIEVPISGTYAGFEGGMTVYYLQRPGPNNDPLHAFPEGFRMLAGHPRHRHYTGTYAAQAISFQCLDYAGTQGGSVQTNGLPTTKCPNGIRGQVFFPSCWDGVHLDSPDHRSHMAYPESQAYNSGPCPASHPVHMISLFYEVIFETDDFSDMWYGDSQPFVFSNGDPTGYGFHGDFYNGWDVSVLQTAIDNCNDMSGNINDCPYFDFYSWDENQACHVPPQVNEDVAGPLTNLPGCNPIQSGPGLAAAINGSCEDAQISSGPQDYTDLTKTMGWGYVGCGSDDVDDRTFQGAQGYNTSETVQDCVAFCADQGYTYAGMEYSTQCYCSNTLPADRAPVAGVLGSCTMPCAGNSKQFCGGPNALSIYQKCASGKACVNHGFVSPGSSKRRVERGTLGMK